MKLGLQLGYWGAQPPEGVGELVAAAEAAGFDAIFTAEALGSDAFTPLAWWGKDTSRVRLGTSIVQMSGRSPASIAMHALTLDHLSQGRFVLGLGVSHQPVNGALEIDMGEPVNAVVEYASAVRSWLRGEGPATHLPQHPAPVAVPIYLAALTSTTVERACGVADGLMPLFWSPERVAQAATWMGRGAAAAASAPAVDLTLGRIMLVAVAIASHIVTALEWSLLLVGGLVVLRTLLVMVVALRHGRRVRRARRLAGRASPLRKPPPGPVTVVVPWAMVALTSESCCRRLAW